MKNMKNTQEITIMLLVVTASVLTTLLVASYVYTEPAQGATAATRGCGDYMIATGSFNQETDFVYVLDIASAKLNVYYPNLNNNTLELGDAVDLAKSFGPVARR